MKEMLIREAAHVFKVEFEDVKFDGVTFSNKENKITLSELGNRLTYNEDQKQLTATGSYVGTKSPPPFMAGFIEIEIDNETFEYTVLNYVSVVDCGTPINPKLAQGQVEGGIVQGLGMAAYEDVQYGSKGNMLSNGFLGYSIPNTKHIVKLTTEFAESYEESGPFGAKSVGEIGIDTPPAALANAVFNATGVRIKTLPITAEKIYQGMLELKQKENKK